MLLRLTSIAGLGLALALSARVALADPVMDGVAAMPGAIEDVRIGGTWEKDGKSGAYRIVISRSGTEKVTARLFVQWVAYQEDGSATVENTIEIADMAKLGADVVDYTSDSDEEGLSVYLDIMKPDGAADENYELHITSPTEYRFGPTTN